MTRATPPRRLSGPERRARIVEAAIERFGARGYEGASIREIAAAAGISKPVLYDHFPSKRALFTALLEEISGELTRVGTEAMAGDAPPGQRIRSAVEAFFAAVEARPAAARVLFVVPRGDPELAADSARVQAGVTAAIAALLAREPGLHAGAPDRALRLEMTAEFLRQGLNGLAEWWLGRPEVAREPVVEIAMEVAWRGLAAQIEAASA